MRFTESNDGHNRASIRISMRIGAPEVIGALALHVRFDRDPADTLAAMSRSEAETAVRDVLKDKGRTATHYARDDYSDRKWRDVQDMAACLFPEIEEQVNEMQDTEDAL